MGWGLRIVSSVYLHSPEAQPAVTPPVLLPQVLHSDPFSSLAVCRAPPQRARLLPFKRFFFRLCTGLHTCFKIIKDYL